MIPVILRLYSQGGQLPDPKDHIYGLANSPKVKDYCKSNCTDAATAVWKSGLVMSYGWGGTEAFMLDITNPFDGSGVKTTTSPVTVEWNTQYLTASSESSIYDNVLGLTTSVPAFYYAKGASKDDYRLIFGSYTTDIATGSMAKVLVNARMKDGSPVDTQTIIPAGSCPQAFGLMSDVATARVYSAGEDEQLMAAYFGDTWGTLRRYVPTVSGPDHFTQETGTVTDVQSFTCDHPVHYAPLIVQLDRLNPTNRPGEVYIVQVTNSALDPQTAAFPASKMIVRRDLGTAGGSVVGDSTFGTGGKIELTAGVGTQMCGETTADGNTCLVALPAGARPNSTPTGIMRADAQGFLVIATWYMPAVDGCNDGSTYLTVHEYSISAGLKQRYAKRLVSEPVTSTVFVGGKLMFASQTGVADLTSSLPVNLKFTQTAGAGSRFRRTGWVELP